MPYFVATPTHEGKKAICQLMAAHEFKNTFDVHNEDTTAARRLHDQLQERAAPQREVMISQLMNQGYGLGAASHTVCVTTSTEAVGVTAGSASSWNTKASYMQNSETGNVVNMSRGQGNSTLGTPAQNMQSCTPRER